MNDNELYHYGIKGMKWGIRRYQKKDGSLTRLGKKRVKEAANLFPKHKGKPVKWNDPSYSNRRKILEEITKDRSNEELKKYQNYVKRNPQFDEKKKHGNNAFDYWNNNLRNKEEALAFRTRYTKRFIDEYSNATLNDLNIKTTEKTKKYIESMIRANKSYDAF